MNEQKTLMEQFAKWKKIIFATCPGKHGKMGLFVCLVDGVNCCLKFCPRRFYLSEKDGEKSIVNLPDTPKLRTVP